MSSDSELASEVAVLQFTNILSLVIVTAVAYDYIITLPKEMHYIWNRPWTFVSAMFFIVRYVGLAVALIEGLYGSTFIPGPTQVSTVLLLASVFAFILFLAAADLMMILRVYAMYRKSRIVLGLLLVLYAATVVLYFISAVHYNNLDNLSMTTPQVLDMSFCNPTYNNTSSKIGDYKLIPRLTLAALLLTLVVARLCIDSFQTYRMTKQWKTNEYISLLAREGILYFFAHLFNNIDFGQTMTGNIITTITFIVFFILSPRFIMSIRELHDYRVNVPVQYDGIDTGFGISKGQSSSMVTASSVGFARTFVTPEGDIEMQVVEGNISSKF
ncbi:hypothetical protein OG21DRAFT_629999 [Imleria badia]|nr:hypothetical protein OG21DRAFT_629999 [Imleria badia]